MGLRQPVLPDLSLLRQQKGISLESIARETRICGRYLEAIERGEFRVLPGGIYDISYLRQYARAIDFDEHALIECYLAATAPPEPASTPAEDMPRALWNVSIRRLLKT
jgi:cytoskeletal protein RodZ